eukprot:PhM_4_TR13657/c0_g1_i1/m.15920
MPSRVSLVRLVICVTVVVALAVDMCAATVRCVYATFGRRSTPLCQWSLHTQSRRVQRRLSAESVMSSSKKKREWKRGVMKMGIPLVVVHSDSTWRPHLHHLQYPSWCYHRRRRRLPLRVLLLPQHQLQHHILLPLGGSS